jgi:hypothetical protein
MQAWPPVCVMLLLNAALMWFRWRRRELSLQEAVFWTVLPGAGAAVWPLRNLLLYGNPMHPWGVLGFGDERYNAISARLANDVAEPLQGYSRLVLFVISALEITRWWGRDFVHAHGGGYSGIHWRMGGWGVYTIAAMLAALIMCSMFVRRSRVAIGGFFILVLTVAISPQSYELRYWIFVPLGWALLCALYVPELGKAARSTILIAIPVLFVVSVQSVAPYTKLWRLDFPVDPVPPLPDEIIEYWDTNGTGNNPLCTSSKVQYQIFLSGPTLTEYEVDRVC